MNRYRTKLLIAMQVFPVVLLTLTVAASASAESSATAPAKEAASPHFSNGPSVTVPPVPDNIKVPPGFTAFLEGHGVGTQNYVCRPSATSRSGFAFVLFTPEATLFSDNGQQLTTHFFSPNPFEANIDPTVVGDRMIRVTWQDSQDTSTVWAKVHQPHGTATVDPNAIAWVLLDVVGAQRGPTGGDTLTATKFIQRLNTHGGLAPSTGCASLGEVGNQAFVDYTADYFFYKSDSQ